MTQERVRTPRMELLLQAALHVVAEHGLRGLTHRAVDREAGLPEGSCSAYLRTRRALVTALTSYVATGVTEDCEELARDLSACHLEDAQAIELVTSFFMRRLDERERLLARMELSLAAARDPELAAMLASNQQQLVELVGSILAARHKDHSGERAATMVASFDGILLGALPLPEASRRPFVRQSIEVLIGGLG
jgi:DNA-binding transcriptional regulator YbjK